MVKRSASNQLQSYVYYKYDTANRMVQRNEWNGTTVIDNYFAGFDGINPTLEFEKVGGGTATASNLKHRYLWGDRPDQLFADEQYNGGATASTTVGNVLWALTDHLGTIRDVADLNGGVFSIVEHRTYDSFGKRTDQPGQTGLISFGYTGKYHDSYTNSTYHWNRWYDPQLGKWLSEDPIGFAGGDANLGRYVVNGVLNYVDSNGLRLISPERFGARWGSVVIDYVKKLEAQNPNMTPAEILDLFQNNMVGNGIKNVVPFAVQLGICNDKAPLNADICHWVYIYSEKEEWIDMGHFLSSARVGRRYPDNVEMIKTLGQAFEDATIDWQNANPNLIGVGSSANTPEDANSNRLGAEFGSNFDPKKPLSEQLSEFFKGLKVWEQGGKLPWNLEMLPPDEATWEAVWKADPKKAMRYIKAVMDKNLPWWKTNPPSGNLMQDRINKNEIWGPSKFPGAYNSNGTLKN